MAEKGKNNCAVWLNFFRDAGISGGFETKYALVFDENRIKMNMLMDLNKGDLRDMGIKAMGDIIAILKHAKIVHDLSMEQAFQNSKPKQSQPANTTSESRENEGPRALSATLSTPTKIVTATNTLKITTSSSALPTKSSEDLATSTSNNIFRVPSVPKGNQIKKAVSPISAKKVTSTLGSTSTTTLPRKRLIVLRSSESDSTPIQLREEVPVQKKIRVLPEHEGKYKIKMPQGTATVAEKPFLNRLGPTTSDTSAKKTGIFNRLGESKVTSTSTIDAPINKCIKPISFSDDDSDYESSRKTSVFARLGGRASTNASPESRVQILQKSTSSASFSPSASKVVPRTMSTANSNSDSRPRENIEIRRSISTTDGGPKITRVYRNPITPNTSQTSNRKEVMGNTSRMRSEIANLSGRLSTIKSRLDIRPSPRSSLRDLQSSEKISIVKRNIEPNVSSENSRIKLNVQPRLLRPITITRPSPNSTKTTFRRVVTRKVNSNIDPADVFDLPELDDPMAPYYDLTTD